MGQTAESDTKTSGAAATLPSERLLPVPPEARTAIEAAGLLLYAATLAQDEGDDRRAERLRESALAIAWLAVHRSRLRRPKPPPEQFPKPPRQDAP